MHLDVRLTTTKTNSKGKKLADTESKRKATADHNEWLKKKGVHPDQLKTKAKGKQSIPDYTITNPYQLSNNIAVKGGFKSGIMTNMHKESVEVQNKIMEWASRAAPLYNKGGLQVITDDTDVTTIGSRSRRG